MTVPSPKAVAHPPVAQSSHSQSSSRPSGSGNPSKEGSAPFRVRTGDNSIPNYGTEVPASERGDATAALSGYLAARARGDWSTACSYLGGATRRQLQVLAGGSKGKHKGCVGTYAMLSARVPAAERANPLTGGLASLRVKGEKAFALFYGPHSQKYVMPMAIEGGAWKVTQLAPIAYPLGAPTTAR